MEIIDNFGLRTRHNAQNFLWLSQALRQVEEASTKSFVVRLTGERKGQDIEFELQNGQNKTSALIAQRRNRLQVQLYKRGIPDPETGFRPALDLVKATTFSALNDDTLDTLAETLQRHLEQDTPYSAGAITKVKVTPTPVPLEPWTFAGGRITSVEHVEDGLRLTVEGTKHIYFAAKDKMHGRRAAGGRYVLFNEAGDFDFVGSNEFDFYFEMKHVEHH